jgi:hypothetical protein
MMKIALLNKTAAILLALVVSPLGGAAAAVEPNTLTPAQVKAGWRLLWDGHSTAGLHGYASATFPDRGWSWDDGTLTVIGSGEDASKRGGDVVIADKVKNFELSLEFRITGKANSGILYFEQGAASGGHKFPIALEFQILDNARHADANKGRDGNRRVSSLYDLIPAKGASVVLPGEWHEAQLVVRGAQVEHWLDGVKVLEYDRSTAEFRALVAESKFAAVTGFGEWPEGRIRLQDHRDTVSFRSIKLRDLP